MKFGEVYFGEKGEFESSMNIAWRSVGVTFGRNANSEPSMNIAWRSVRVTLGEKGEF